MPGFVALTLTANGAQVILLPSKWAPGVLKEHHWRTLVTARAIENAESIRSQAL